LLGALDQVGRPNDRACDSHRSVDARDLCAVARSLDVEVIEARTTADRTEKLLVDRLADQRSDGAADRPAERAPDGAQDQGRHELNTLDPDPFARRALDRPLGHSA